MTRFAVIAVALLGAALYANTLEAPFILDDAPNITENPHLRLQRLDLEGLLAATRGPTRGRPVAYASFALNHLVGGYDVTGYHLVNIVIHVACGILVYLLAAATLALRTHTTHAPALSARRSELAALFAALFFVAHPRPGPGRHLRGAADDQPGDAEARARLQRVEALSYPRR